MNIMNSWTVKELKEWLDKCDPNSKIEFLYHDTIQDIPKHPKCKMYLCRYAHYKKAKTLVLNFTHLEDINDV